jgi:hypothetical protein
MVSAFGFALGCSGFKWLGNGVKLLSFIEKLFDFG